MLHVLTLLDLRSRRFGSYIEQELSEFLGPTTAEPMTTIEGCMSGVRRLNAAMHIRINEIGAEREASQAQTKLTESKLGLSMREAMGLVGRTQKQREYQNYDAMAAHHNAGTHTHWHPCSQGITSYLVGCSEDGRKRRSKTKCCSTCRTALEQTVRRSV